jgi:hypothetical protein
MLTLPLPYYFTLPLWKVTSQQGAGFHSNTSASQVPAGKARVPKGEIEKSSAVGKPLFCRCAADQ